MHVNFFDTVTEGKAVRRLVVSAVLVKVQHLAADFESERFESQALGLAVAGLHTGFVVGAGLHELVELFISVYPWFRYIHVSG